MRKATILTWLLFMGILTGFSTVFGAENSFKQITGKGFDSAMPKDFYLEGNAIPTEKRNAALVKNPAGARVLVALIDTSGYSSQIQQKYYGMLITEGSVSVCGSNAAVGSYGFGLEKPGAKSDGDAKFFLYNQAGEKVGECAAKKDDQLKTPKPLQVVLSEERAARLYLGRYWIELR